MDSMDGPIAMCCWFINFLVVLDNVY